MKIITKQIPLDFQTGIQRNSEHVDYHMIENGPEIPRKVLEYVVSTLSPTWQLLPLVYQLATQADVVVECGVGYGKVTESILWGLRDGNKSGHLFSIDLGHTHSREVKNRVRAQPDIKNLWSILWSDVFLVPDNLLEMMQADFIFSDVEVREREPEVYECIYPTEPRIDRTIPRSHINLIKKMDKALKVGGLFVMRYYDTSNSILGPFIGEGKYEVVFDFWSLNTFRSLVLRKL
jgi:hypothetical protein